MTGKSRTTEIFKNKSVKKNPFRGPIFHRWLTIPRRFQLFGSQSPKSISTTPNCTMYSQTLSSPEINEMKIELTALYKSISSDGELERMLYEENCNLRAHLHLEDARLELHKLKQSEARRNTLMVKQLRKMNSTMSEKTCKYKAMIQVLKEENQKLIELIRTLQSKPLSMSKGKKTKEKRNFLRRLSPSRILIRQRMPTSAAA